MHSNGIEVDGVGLLRRRGAAPKDGRGALAARHFELTSKLAVFSEAVNALSLPGPASTDGTDAYAGIRFVGLSRPVPLGTWRQTAAVTLLTQRTFSECPSGCGRNQVVNPEPPRPGRVGEFFPAGNCDRSSCSQRHLDHRAVPVPMSIAHRLRRGQSPGPRVSSR